MCEEVKWIFIKEESAAGIVCEEYVSEDGKLGRLVYNDGYEEIYEIADCYVIKP